MRGPLARIAGRSRLAKEFCVARTGIGPALRKARLTRGKSIEEASRETRIRAEYLQALERETFESMLGAVYVTCFPARPPPIWDWTPTRSSRSTTATPVVRARRFR